MMVQTKAMFGTNFSSRRPTIAMRKVSFVIPDCRNTPKSLCMLCALIIIVRISIIISIFCINRQAYNKQVLDLRFASFDCICSLFFFHHQSTQLGNLRSLSFKHPLFNHFSHDYDWRNWCSNFNGIRHLSSVNKCFDRHIRILSCNHNSQESHMDWNTWLKQFQVWKNLIFRTCEKSS